MIINGYCHLFLFKFDFSMPTPLEILNKTIEVNGGDTWQQPQTLMLDGNATFTPFGKVSEQKHFDYYRMFRVFPKENDAAHKANGKIRFDVRSGDDLFMNLVFDGKNTLNYLSEEAQKYKQHFAWSNNFGFSIIRFATQDGYEVERLTDDYVEDSPCFVVKIIDPKQMTTLFWIDQKTYYIRSIAFVTELGYHHRIYSGFEKIIINENQFFVQPTRLRVYFDGLKWMDVNWVKFEINKEIDDNVFV
jgi:outer membrane lipoprotein-sorting protein